MAAPANCQDLAASPAFRPPPGLTKKDDTDLTFAPGLEIPIVSAWRSNCTLQVPTTIPMEQWSLEYLKMVSIHYQALANDANLHIPQKVYPPRPPGHFDTASCASTAVSDMGEEHDEILPCESYPAEEGKCHDFSSRKLQVEPIDMALGTALKVTWPVDSRKLRCRDKSIVSPSFNLCSGCSFKLMLKPKPKPTGDKKHQEGFQWAKGRGSVELKCVEGSASAPALKFWVTVGDAPMREADTHAFSESTVAGLKKGEEVFNFDSACDDKSSMFLVTLHALQIDSSRC